MNVTRRRTQDNGQLVKGSHCTNVIQGRRILPTETGEDSHSDNNWHED